MRICEILMQNQPDVLFTLCEWFNLVVRDYDSMIPRPPIQAMMHLSGTDWAREMVTDAEGRYLDYTRGRA